MVLILVLGVGHVSLLALQSAVATAGETVAAEAPTVSQGQFVVRDTLDDNIRGAMWQALADDPNNCMMKEINQRYFPKESA